jgi:hypothetical protein
MEHTNICTGNSNVTETRLSHEGKIVNKVDFIKKQIKDEGKRREAMVENNKRTNK